MKVLRFINDQTYTQVITLDAKGVSPSDRATEIKADPADVKRALPSNRRSLAGSLLQGSYAWRAPFRRRGLRDPARSSQPLGTWPGGCRILSEFRP